MPDPVFTIRRRFPVMLEDVFEVRLTPKQVAAAGDDIDGYLLDNFGVIAMCAYAVRDDPIALAAYADRDDQIALAAHAGKFDARLVWEDQYHADLESPDDEYVFEANG